MKRILRATGLAELGALDEGRWDGVRFGAEFCHRRLPPPADVARARTLCVARGLTFSLVAPLTRESAFDFVSGWLRASLVPGESWTANDWGLLHWAKEAGFDGRPSAGRLLGRQRRDPRVLGLMAGADDFERESLTGSLWDDPEAVRIARGLGVAGVELDAPLQGLRGPALVVGMEIAVHGPWAVVTVTPDCPWTPEPLHCALDCRKAPKLSQVSVEDPHPLHSRGNALFVEVGEDHARRVAETVGADVLILSPVIPG